MGPRRTVNKMLVLDTLLGPGHGPGDALVVSPWLQ